MGRGKWLTAEEKGAIDALLKIFIGIPSIANNVQRSKTAVRNYVAKKIKCGEEKGRAATSTI